MLLKKAKNSSVYKQEAKKDDESLQKAIEKAIEDAIESAVDKAMEKIKSKITNMKKKEIINKAVKKHDL